jgi:hypothetical protein
MRASKADKMLIEYLKAEKGLDESLWTHLENDEMQFEKDIFYQLIYNFGIQTNELRKKVWPYLLGHYDFSMSEEEKSVKDKKSSENYKSLISTWKVYETFINSCEEMRANSLNTTPKLNKKDEDSGIYSDLSGSSSLLSPKYSSQKNGKYISRKNSLNPNLNKKRLFSHNFNTFKQRLLQTPVSTNKLNIYSPETTLNKGKLKELVDRINIFNNEEDSKLSFISSFKKSSYLSKLIKKNDDTHSARICQVTTQTTPAKMKIFQEEFNLEKDKNCRELAEVLVSNAIFRAIHQLNEESSKQTNQIDVSIKSLDHLNSNMGLNSTDSAITRSNCSATTNSAMITSATLSIETDENYLQQDNLNNNAENTNELSTPCLMWTSIASDFESMSENNIHNSNLSCCQQDSLTQSTKSSESDLNKETIEKFSLNMHRIDKDVARCDRNYWYFQSPENLNKLKNIMYTWVFFISFLSQLTSTTNQLLF